MYTMEYYSDIKGKVLPFETTQMDLENITLSKRSQTDSQEPYDFTQMWDTKLKAIN